LRDERDLSREESQIESRGPETVHVLSFLVLYDANDKRELSLGAILCGLQVFEAQLIFDHRSEKMHRATGKETKNNLERF
jgi:hypothetical protein